MLFWNSEGGNADIVAALQNLANNLGNLDFARFSESKLKIAIAPQDTITKIVNREEVSRRTTLEVSSDSEASKVLLIHGMAEPTLDDFLKSPWSLKSGEQGCDDLDGGYEIYAYAIGGNANIKIALEYQGDNQLIDRVNNFMEIQPLFGTGTNWDNSTRWAVNYEAELNSAISGFKLFSFSSFTAQEYNLIINPGSLSYQAIAYPINIYLFTLDSISKALFWKFIDGMNGWANLQTIKEDIIPILKKGSWAARLPATGGTFSLKPTYDRHIGLIDCKLVGQSYAKTAIFNYQGGTDTGTFTLVGP
ncbi:MAG: hypothetical protein SXA11_06950 [Cyanobacteriota bacterium]|nr:hypothetical protein [Cyanobacteriota bacterium]